MLIWVWAAWDSSVEVDQHVPLWWRLTCCAAGAPTIAVNLSRDPHNVLFAPDIPLGSQFLDRILSSQQTCAGSCARNTCSHP